MTNDFLSELAARRRFGMKPGLDTIRTVCASLGDPQKQFKAIHVAGTNGKGAVCAILDSCLAGVEKLESPKVGKSGSPRIGRYTSPHLVRINERFFLDGRPVDDETLERAAAKVTSVLAPDLTFFEALTAVAFLIYAEAKCAHVILETGLGGRLDATNVCEPELCIITRIGLDHCDWLGDTVEKVAAEKAGIIKSGVPVVLGRNAESVRAVVESRAKEVGAPFHYAPDLASESEIPSDFSLVGSFNRENAVTVLAALKVLLKTQTLSIQTTRRLSQVVWPGRFQRVGNVIVDGAHNPPAAQALARALSDLQSSQLSDFPNSQLSLIAGFCGDKDVDEVLRILKPFVREGFAVRTNNPRSLSAEETAVHMRSVGIPAVACDSLADALAQTGGVHGVPTQTPKHPNTLICGSLFLAGEALVALGAYPWPSDRFDAAELLKV
jgi:dihydrofolate synthase / folylpolyglutamate synthase